MLSSYPYRYSISHFFTNRKLFCISSFSRSIRISLIKATKDKLSVYEDNVNKFGASEKSTLVGPPHPVSNLRLKVFPSLKKITLDEQLFYQKSQETQEWNQQYWESHNRDFTESKESYIKEIAKTKKDAEYIPSTDEMADFYRKFLNRNYEKHVLYNWEWYKKNFYLIYLSAKAQLSKLKNRES